MNVIPVQASTLSQSSTVTVTGGHYYTYTYWQEVQTGTQQVQTGTAEGSFITSFGTCYTGGNAANMGVTNECSYYYPYYPYQNSPTTEVVLKDWGKYGASIYTNSMYEYFIVPVYTTEPVYTNEQFIGTAWSPATIS